MSAFGWQPTEEQARVLSARDPVVVVEAGAGSGKTGTLTRLYVESVLEGLRPQEILAFTFTRRAASELRGRISSALSRSASEATSRSERERLREDAQAMGSAWIGTIDSFCQRLLRASSTAAGLDPRFGVADEMRQRILAHQAFDEALHELLGEGLAGLDRLVALERAADLRSSLLGLHALLRSRGEARPTLPRPGEVVLTDDEGKPVEAQSPDRSARIEERARRVEAERDALAALLDRFHDRYEQLKSEHAMLDFGDLELRALELLESSADAAHEWSQRFRLVLVDELQDTNPLQLDLVSRLRGPETRLVSVGDELQSIYGFRNADVEAFRRHRDAVDQDPEGVVLGLRGNFRSTPSIIATVNAVAEALIRDYRPLTVPAATAPESPGEGSELLVVSGPRGANDLKWSDLSEELGATDTESANAACEALALARRVRELVDDEKSGIRAGDVAVLARTRSNFESLRRAFERYGLNPFVGGGSGYWSSQQVEDALALLGVVANPLDDMCVFGALASPAVGASADSLLLLRRAAGRDQSVWPGVQRLAAGERHGRFEGDEALALMDARDRERIAELCERVSRLRLRAASLGLAELTEEAIDTFRLDLTALTRDHGEQRVANLRRLVVLAGQHEEASGRDLTGFLLQAAERMEDDRDGPAVTSAEGHDGVRIMTIHSVKGEQFPVVCLANLGRKLSSDPGGTLRVGGVGEERLGLRLARIGEEDERAWEHVRLCEEAQAREVEEELRLIYVATTRAERKLILSGVLTPNALERIEAARRSAPEGSLTEPALERIGRALARHGWAGGDGTVELPPAELDEGGTAPGPVRVTARVLAPGAELARELAGGAPARAPAPASNGDGAVAEHPDLPTPPLLDRLERPTPVGAISYSALAAHDRCAYRFYVERVLGMAQRDPEGPEGSGDPGAGGRAFGSAVHLALERSAMDRWRRPSDEELAELLRAQGLEEERGLKASVERARRMVDGWLDSALRRELDGAAVEAEPPFALPLAGAIVHGFIDLLATGAGAPLVVDYKTDRLDEGGVAAAGERYRRQRQTYALAARAADPEAAAAHGVRAVHVFLERPEDPVEEAFDADGLEACETVLEDEVRRIRSGDFPPTSEPSVAVCSGCPAAERLCPVAAWQPAPLATG